MENKEVNPSASGKFSIIKAKFDLEANKRNYNLLLQKLASTDITRDNLNEDVTKEARDILKMLTDLKDEQSKEPLAWHRDIMSVYNSVHGPINEQVKRILGQKKSLSSTVQAEKDMQIAEQARINTAKTAIVNFTNKIANLIANAKTEEDVVVIEKTIGLEKTRKSLYQEFLSDLITQVDGLRPQIKHLKGAISDLKSIEEASKLAISSGDIIRATQLMEEKEFAEQVIQETGIRIHEKAYEQAITIDIVAPEVMDIAPKGRANWKWRVDDIKLLQRKMPELVRLVPDEDAISEMLSEKRKDGSLKGQTEVTLNGIVFYNDPNFTK